MIKKLSKVLIGFFLVFLIFFFPFIFQGKIPIPADTILGMYHPWRDQVWDNLVAGVPFKNFLITDPVRQQYIWKKLVIESFKNGEIPFWNPYTHSGMPLLANFQSGAFYPLNLIFLVFNFNFAWAVYILLQPLLASLFMFFFLKEIKLSNLASFFGSLVFSFSGFMTAWFEWGNIGHTALWLPLILLAIEKNLKTISWKWLLVCLFALVSTFFAGHLQVFFYLFLVSMFYLLWRIFNSELKSKQKIKILFSFFVAFLLVFLLTSIQWLPTLQLIKLSARNINQPSLINQRDWFLPLKHLVQFIAPDFFGNPATLNYWGEWNYGELVGYIGIIPLILSFFAIVVGGFNFWLVALFVAFLFLLPTPLAKLPFQLRLPLISTSQPTRLLFIVDFCLSVLSAIGFNILTRHLKASRKKLIISICLVFFILLFLWAFSYSRQLIVSLRNLILPSGLVLMFMIFVFLISKKSLRLSGLLIISITVFDLIRFSWKFNPFVKEDWIFPKTKVIEFLEKDKSLWRMASLDRRIFPPNFSAFYHFSTIEGYDPLYLKNYGCLITRVESGVKETENCANFNRIISPQNSTSVLMDKLNVKYFLSLNEISDPKLKKVFEAGETKVYENLKVKPRIFLADGEVVNLDYMENKISIEVENKNEGNLILRDLYYPGWKAKVDDKEQVIFLAEDYFRGVSVPAGRHKIDFFYWPSP